MLPLQQISVVWGVCMYVCIIFIIFIFTFSPAFLEAGKQKQPSPKKNSISCIRKFLDNFHSVERGILYRSGQLSPKYLERYVQRFDIKTIINLRGNNADKDWWQKEDALTKQYGLKFYNIPMTARRLPSKEHLLQLLHLYKTAPKPILIHCYGGVERTGEAAALWVLEQQKKRKKDALKQLSLKYGYWQSKKHPKYFFISIWQGKDWLEKTYCPKKYQQAPV